MTSKSPSRDTLTFPPLSPDEAPPLPVPSTVETMETTGWNRFVTHGFILCEGRFFFRVQVVSGGKMEVDSLKQIKVDLKPAASCHLHHCCTATLFNNGIREVTLNVTFTFT